MLQAYGCPLGLLLCQAKHACNVWEYFKIPAHTVHYQVPLYLHVIANSTIYVPYMYVIKSG